MNRHDTRNTYPFHNQTVHAPRVRFTYTPKRKPSRVARIASATMGALASVAALVFTFAR